MMRHLLLLLSVICVSCENQSFESDKRQIIAKNEIRRQLHNARFFDITGFKQDTLETYPDTTFKHPLRYGLDFVFTDSSGRVRKQKAIVLFAPGGTSVLNSQIIDED